MKRLIPFALLGILIIAAACWAADKAIDETPAGLPEPRGAVFPTGTPTPYGGPGLISWDLRGQPTIYPGQNAIFWQFYPNEVQANATATPDWRAVQTRVAYNASLGVKTLLGSAMFDAATWPTPDVVRLPQYVPTVAYNSGAPCGTNYAPDYGNATFQAWSASFLQSLFATFDGNPNVIGYSLDPGIDQESMNVKAGSDCPLKQQMFEQVVSCDAYRNWHQQMFEVAAAYTTKPVFFPVLPPCYGSSGWYNNKYYAELSVPSTPLPGTPAPTPFPTPRYVGIRQNNWNVRNAPDCWMYENMAEWGICQVIKRMNYLGGGMPHTDIAIDNLIPTPERVSFMDTIAWRVLASQASYWVIKPEHWPYLRADTLNVVTLTLGTDYWNSPAAALRFASALHGRGGGLGWTYSDYPEPPGHLLRIAQLSPTPVPTRYGQLQYVATPIAGYPYPPVPDVAAPTPGAGVAPEYANYMAWASGATVPLDVDDRWLATFTGTAVVRWLDSGTGSWQLAWRSGGSTVTQTINKSNSGQWTASTISLSSARFDNGLSTGGDLEIRLTSGSTAFYSIVLQGTGTSGATPTPTPTATRTPTPTFTITPTPTRTPTATPAIGVRFNEVSPNSALDWNLDGSVTAADNWFELINWTASATSLAGWQIGNGSVTRTLPPVFLPAYNMYVLLAENTLPIPASGTLTLYNAQATPVATVTYSAQQSGKCYAAIPNGSATWQDNRTCTPGRANE